MTDVLDDIRLTMMPVRTEARLLSSGSTRITHALTSLTRTTDSSCGYAIRYQTPEAHKLHQTVAIRKRRPNGVSD